MLTRIIILLTGYAFGLFQTGWFFGKYCGVNLKEHGSGNTGATNALRVMGIKGGLIVLIGDMLKGFVPCILVRIIFNDADIETLNAYILYCALGCVLGNNYPFYLNFNGGKGVAVSLGWLIAWYMPAVGVCIVVFAIIVFSTGYVSVASMACCAVVIAATHLYAAFFFGPLRMLSTAGVEFTALGFIIPALVIIRHRDNIKRLIAGTENRFKKK